MDLMARVAYHEAAHCVADITFGFDVYGCNIIETERQKGATEGAGAGDSIDEAKQRLIGLLAGYAAAIKMYPRHEQQARAEAGDDFQKADRILQAIGEPHIDPWMLKAKDFVERNWTAIEIIASDLLKYKNLDIDELELLLEIAKGDEAAKSALNSYRVLIGRT